MKIGNRITEFHFIQYTRQTVSMTDLYSMHIFNHVLANLWHKIDIIERPYYLAMFQL